MNGFSFEFIHQRWIGTHKDIDFEEGNEYNSLI